MSTMRRKHTAEFKQGALDLAKQLGNITEAARQLGICDSLIHSWKRRERQAQGQTPSPPSAGSVEEQNARLRRENQELRKVNQILKAAAAFFSQDHLK